MNIFLRVDGELYNIDIFENITCYKRPILNEEEIIRLITNDQPVYINLSR